MSGISVIRPNLHFFQYIQAYKPFADPVPSNTKQYQLMLTKYLPVSSYTDKYHVAEWKMPAPLMCPSFSFVRAAKRILAFWCLVLCLERGLGVSALKTDTAEQPEEIWKQQVYMKEH